MEKAADGKFVRVEYTGTLSNGEVFDTSRERSPLAGESLTFEVEVVSISDTATPTRAGCGCGCDSECESPSGCSSASGCGCS